MVLLQVCTVLAHLAAVGVAHRDLKLDNLTLAAAASTLPDEVRVIDFGCSVVHDDLVGDPAVNTEAIPKAVAVSDTSARQQDPSAQSDVASATGDEVLDTHHKFLKKRRSSSLLVGNQQNWAPELWTLARQQQHVRAIAVLVLVRVGVLVLSTASVALQRMLIRGGCRLCRRCSIQRPSA